MGRNKERLDGYKTEAVKFIDLAYQAGSIDQTEYHQEERTRLLNQVIKLAAMDGFESECNEKAMEYMVGFMKSTQELLPDLKKNIDRLEFWIKHIHCIKIEPCSDEFYLQIFDYDYEDNGYELVVGKRVETVVEAIDWIMDYAKDNVMDTYEIVEAKNNESFT